MDTAYRPVNAANGQLNGSAAIRLTGTQFEISAGEYRATVTELGAGLRQLSHRGRPLIVGYDDDELPPAAAGQLLAPWPNRIDRGRYTFSGTEYQLDLSEPSLGNAIHGLTRWRNWAPKKHEADRVLLKHVSHGREGYPFCLEIDVDYRLTADTGLEVTMTARNSGTRPAPYGTGAHPYLTAGTPVIDECELALPAAQWLPVDDRCIPFGPVKDVDGTPYDFRRPRPIGGVRLDHTLTGLERDGDGRAWARLGMNGSHVSLWVDEGYRWLQVFSGDVLDASHRRCALAIEPMTCPPNAFASGTDLLTLEPGQEVRHTWGISVHAS
jgi:aldose 1-epimerase